MSSCPDYRAAYDEIGKIIYMTQSGGYVMVKRPRCMPFCMSIKDWNKLSREPKT